MELASPIIWHLKAENQGKSMMHFENLGAGIDSSLCLKSEVLKTKSAKSSRRFRSHLKHSFKAVSKFNFCLPLVLFKPSTDPTVPPFRTLPRY